MPFKSLMEVSAIEKEARLKERKRIGKLFWKWFYGKSSEPIEDAIERITKVKDPNN